jgi:antitoxin component YwqK of YwqJK toxin-antitoxin module
VSHEGKFQNGKRSGEWKYYYPEGMLHLVYSWREGKVHGLYKEFYRTGQLKIEKSFENGDHHGLSREYRIDGTLQEQGWYQHDKAEQTWITYYPNAAVETVNYYREGDLISSIDYSMDQKLYSKFEYKGDLITLVEYYDEDGTPILSLNDISKDNQGVSKYKNGNTQFIFSVDCGLYSGVTRYWPNGKKMLEVAAFEGRRSGLYRSLNEKEQVLTEGRYFQSKETGRWTWLYDNGKLETEGFYVNGDRDSVWSYYNEVGTLTHTVEYMDDERHGISTYNSGSGTKALEKKYRSGDVVEFRVLRNGVMSPWQPFTGNEDMVATLSNGQKIYEEHYKSGLLDGPRTAWYDNGKVAYQYNFSKGLYEGAYVCYYPDGTVSEKGTYKLDEYEGPREQFDEKGKRIRYEEYKMGTRDGKAILSNGQEVRYWNGSLVD